MTARRDEAALERQILVDLGSQPDVLALKLEVGHFLRLGLLAELCSTCRPAAARYRVEIGQPGTPDLLLSVAGAFVGCELKTPIGRLRPEQVAWHAAARRRGVLVEVVRSVDEARALVARARADAGGGR